MPIPYEALSYNEMLHHQVAYECFDKAGKSLFSEWDIIGFEKAVLDAGDSYYKLPMDEGFFFEKYKSIAKEFGLSINGNRHEYIERFAAGGMSSGIVTEVFVRQGWHTVRHRNRLYKKDGDIKDYYLDKAIERINLYCKKYDKGLS